MNDKLLESKGIYEKAVTDYNPYAVVVMVSGGDDSLAMLAAANELGIEYDAIVHLNTRTGVQETFEHVQRVASSLNVPLWVGDAGNAYVDYITRKGFFGKGQKAHSYAYHLLKAGPLRKLISAKVRKRKRGRRVLMLNGARVQESANRASNMKSPYRRDPAAKSNIWVNLIHGWSKRDCLDMLNNSAVERSPVAALCHRSAECMCGTMQTKEEAREVRFWFPKWGEWLDDVNEIGGVYGWQWGENMPAHFNEMNKGQMAFDFMPMCHGCKLKGNNNERTNE